MVQKRILIFAALIIAIIVIGVFGYYFIESLSFIDALYMTVITISTVGFGEVRSLSNAGKIFTIILIVCGIAIITTGVSMIFTAILEGTFRDTLRRHRMAKRLEKIRGHFIICGFGQVGHDVIDEFTRAQEEFVIIEKHEERLDILQEKKSELLYVLGDATEDEILKKASIERAKGIIAVTGSDTDNLYIAGVFHEPHMEKLVEHYWGYDGPYHWAGGTDELELFIRNGEAIYNGPLDEEGEYYHFSDDNLITYNQKAMPNGA